MKIVKPSVEKRESPAEEIGLAPARVLPPPSAAVYQWSCPYCKRGFQDPLTPDMLDLLRCGIRLPEVKSCPDCDAAYDRKVEQEYKLAPADEMLAAKVAEMSDDKRAEILNRWRQFADPKTRYPLREQLRYSKMIAIVTGETTTSSLPTWWELKCPKEFQNTELARIPCLEAAKKVQQWQYNSRGLVLHGPTGMGKSRSIWLLLKRVSVQHRTMAACMSRFSDELQSQFEDNGNVLDWLNQFAEADILFLDDLDKCVVQRGTRQFTPRTQNALFSILKYRCEQQLPTFITTNVCGPDLAAFFSVDIGGPFLERIRDHCDVICFTK